MTNNHVIVENFVSLQTKKLVDVWHNLPSVDFSPQYQYSDSDKQKNEEVLSSLLEWLSGELDRPRQTEADRKKFSQQLKERAKSAGKEIFGFSEPQVNCFEELGVARVAGEFHQQARQFDPKICSADIFQAGRNVWTGNYLQVLLGLPVALTPSLFAYSMLYPVSDNYLDSPQRSRQEKVEFNQRFRAWLKGEDAHPANSSEVQVFDLVKLFETQYDRKKFPQVYASLLAIHTAQEKSVHYQFKNREMLQKDIMEITFEKGGTSVLADGLLVAGQLTEKQMEIIFNYGAFAQLMDDQEDLYVDLKQGFITPFTKAARRGRVDATMNKVFHFAHWALLGLNAFDNERARPLKETSLMGIDLIMVDAVLRTEKYYSRKYLKQLEDFYPFRFVYIKKVRKLIQQRKMSLERLMPLLTPTDHPINSSGTHNSLELNPEKI